MDLDFNNWLTREKACCYFITFLLSLYSLIGVAGDVYSQVPLFDQPRDFTGTYSMKYSMSNITDEHRECIQTYPPAVLTLSLANTSHGENDIRMDYKGVLTYTSNYAFWTRQADLCGELSACWVNYYAWPLLYDFTFSIDWFLAANEGRWGIGVDTYSSASITEGPIRPETIPCGGVYGQTIEGSLSWQATTGSSDEVTDLGKGYGLQMNFYENYPTDIEWEKNLECGIEKYGADYIPRRPCMMLSGFFDMGASNPFLADLKGTIKGQVTAAMQVETLDDNDIQQATVTLYKQDGFVRAQGIGETDEQYQEFLDSQGRQAAKDPITITPKDLGLFSFEDVPVLESVSIGGTSTERFAYYTIEVTNAETEEVVTLVDDKGSIIGTKTAPLYFTKSTTRNLKPNADEKILLQPFDGIGAKQELVDALSKRSPHNYSLIEIDATVFLNEIVQDQEKKTPEILEGLKRAIWAERVIHGGADFSDQLIELALQGLGKFLADSFDEITKHMMRGKSSAEKDIQRVETQIDAINKGRWKLDRNPDLRGQLENHLDLLKRRKKNAEILGDTIRKVIKAIRGMVAVALIEAGVDHTTAEMVTNALRKVFDILLRALKSSALDGFSGRGLLPGGLVGAAKAAIPIAVAEAQPILFDDPVLASYCKETSEFLQFSVDQLIRPWDQADETRYRNDIDNVAEILKTINDASSTAVAATQLNLGIAEGADAVEAGAAVIGTAVKWVKVVEKVAKSVKFIMTGVTAVAPLVVVYGPLRDAVKEGSFKAFGSDASVSSSLSKPIQVQLQGEVGSPAITAGANPRLFSMISGATQGFTSVLDLLSDSLKADDLGAALELTGGNSPVSYGNKMSEFNQAVSVFLTQALAAEEDLAELLIEDLEYKVLEADLADRITDLYLQIMTLEFKDPEDPGYLAERNKIVSVIDSLIRKINQFVQSLEDLAANLGGLNLLPAIAVQTSRFSSDENDRDTITLAPEVFTLRIHVSNISAVPVSGLSAKLTVTSAKDSVTIYPGLELPVGSKTLAADDGIDGSGEDEADVEWKVKYQGDLSAEVLFIAVSLLENGAESSSFVANEALNILVVDPSLADQDLDFMPDDLERAKGLDTTKDDALEDKDSDGLVNLREFELGTDPQNPDTDGDGLFDGEEVTGGADGFVTSPLDEDTDNDGVNDASDGQPVDGATAEPGELIGEPEVAVDATEVTLSKEEWIAAVTVTNKSAGTLAWTATTDNDAIAEVIPSSPDKRNGDGLLLIAVPAGYDFAIPCPSQTAIRVTDVSGATKDHQEIIARVVPDDFSEDGCGVNDGVCRLIGISPEKITHRQHLPQVKVLTITADSANFDVTSKVTFDDRQDTAMRVLFSLPRGNNQIKAAIIVPPETVPGDYDVGVVTGDESCTGISLTIE